MSSQHKKIYEFNFYVLNYAIRVKIEKAEPL